MLSIIVPTYNEKENIPQLVKRIFKVLDENKIEGELVIVDDNSPDGTAKVAEDLKSSYNIQVIVRKNERGLSSAAIKGMESAKGDVLCVMDADLSHPPEVLPKMLKHIQNEEAELVIGSRHVPGGGIENWTMKRKIVSKCASLIARPVTKVKDPMSGFFMLKREVIEGVELKPKGYKIGLEIIVKGNYEHLVEEPYVFKNRAYGESKLGAKVVKNYLSHALSLYFHKDSSFYQFLKFCAVGGLGIFVDLGVFSLVYYSFFLNAYGQITGTLYSQTISFGAAVTFNYALNKVWTFQDKERRKSKVTKQYFMFVAVALGAWLIRTLIIDTMLTYQDAWSSYKGPLVNLFVSLLSIERFVLLIAIIIVMLVNFFGSKYLVFKREKRIVKPSEN
ncbi:MAG: glycosyltransferase family 2 protein [Thermoplasmata archaeon]|nr:MAG: glycosyltransferase family 2 protein [Thermoplasmata archaeon]